MEQKVPEAGESEKKEVDLASPEGERLVQVSLELIKLRSRREQIKKYMGRLQSECFELELIIQHKEEEFENLQGGQLVMDVEE